MCPRLAAALGNVTIVQKGASGELAHFPFFSISIGLHLPLICIIYSLLANLLHFCYSFSSRLTISIRIFHIDIISNGNPIPFLETQSKNLVNESKGGLKRCGGQGDILSGAMGVMAAWAGLWAEGAYKSVYPPFLLLLSQVILFHSR